MWASRVDNAPTTSCRTSRPAPRESVETTIRKRSASSLRGGRTTYDQWAADTLVDVWDDGWWGESGTRPTRKELGPMSTAADDFRDFQAVQGSTEKLPPLLFGVEAVTSPMAPKKSGKWYRGGCRSGGLLVAQGPGGEELATPRN